MKRTLLVAVALVSVLLVTLVVFGLPLFPSLSLLIEGAFGDKFAWGRTAAKATPLLFTGLGMTVAWRTGIYNVGGEGQYILGGLGAAWFFRVFNPDSVMLSIPAQLILAAICGGLWASIAGWLSIKRGVETVISTILLNFIAIQLLDWVVNGPLKQREGGTPLTDRLPDSLMLWRPDRQTDLHLGIVLALLTALLVHLFLFRRVEGYRMRLVGENRRVARAYRINADRSQLGAMFLSGALCGLGGAVHYLGSTAQIGRSFSEQWGFVGIPVALLAGLEPLFVIPSAFFFGALFAGSTNLARFTSAGDTIVYVIQAVAVLAYLAVRSLDLHIFRSPSPP
ncbi:ABC transporter permease [soil metagenome]